MTPEPIPVDLAAALTGYKPWAVLFLGDAHPDGTSRIEAVMVWANGPDDAALKVARPRGATGSFWPVELPPAINVTLQVLPPN